MNYPDDPFEYYIDEEDNSIYLCQSSEDCTCMIDIRGFVQVSPVWKESKMKKFESYPELIKYLAARL